MPFARVPGNFNDISATFNGVLPICTLSQASERFYKSLDHIADIRFGGNCECKMLIAVTCCDFNVTENPCKLLPYPGLTWYGTDFAESITAVDGNRNLFATMVTS